MDAGSRLVQLDLYTRRKPSTQAAAILADLKAGKGITPLDALRDHGCFRLAARVNELRGLGYPILTIRHTTENGKSIASYRLLP